MYKVAFGYNPASLEKSVCEYMEQGYELYGNMVVGVNGAVYQSLVKPKTSLAVNELSLTALSQSDPNTKYMIAFDDGTGSLDSGVYGPTSSLAECLEYPGNMFQTIVACSENGDKTQLYKWDIVEKDGKPHSGWVSLAVTIEG